jgi:predicted Fe-S protein YdhL (DUF1289 family)
VSADDVPLPIPVLTRVLAARRAPVVPSPCVQRCELDPASRRCRGCLRTVEEIEVWPRASDRRRRAILRRIEGRRIADD